MRDYETYIEARISAVIHRFGYHPSLRLLTAAVREEPTTVHG